METHFAGKDVTVTIPFVTADGSLADTPTAVSYRVLDSAGAEVVSNTTLTPADGDTFASVVVVAANNALPAGKVRAFRQIEVSFTAGDLNTYKAFDEYIIEATDLLRIGVNSFQTYGDASIRALDLAGLDFYSTADRASRVTALVNAFYNLSGLVFHVDGTTYANIATITDVAFAALPEQFRTLLGMAQIVEANEAMNAFSISRKRQAGLMSETIGESSMMFRPEKVLPIPVTRRSLDLLRGYVVWELSSARA